MDLSLELSSAIVPSSSPASSRQSCAPDLSPMMPRTPGIATPASMDLSLMTSTSVYVSLTERSEEDLLDKSSEDLSKEELISKFVNDTCCCHQGPNKAPCSQQLSKELITQCRLESLELARSELDLVVLGQIRSYFKRNSRLSFAIHGLTICRSTFMFLHCIGRTRFDNLVQQYQDVGLTTRSHGNL